MVSMVANLTLGKKGYEPVQQVAEDALKGTMEAIAELERLFELDMEAFETIMDAWLLPSATPNEKNLRMAALNTAAKKASEVPLRICNVCLDILRLAALVAPAGTRSAISDVGVGTHLADAALRGAMLNVDANLPSIREEGFRLALLDEKERLLREAEMLTVVALAEVGKRL